MELYEDSPASSEHSTGSTILPHSAGDNVEHSLHRDTGTGMNSTQIEDEKKVDGCEKGVVSTETVDQGNIIHSHDK